MEKAKLVIADIDNTLAVKRQPLTERAYNAIQALQAQGVQAREVLRLDW